MRRRLSVLLHPGAGRGRGARSAGRALERLRRRGAAVEVLVGRDRADAAARARAAVASRPDALVVVGGDGSVHLAVGALAGSGVPLAVVPTGTGNDVACELGLPADPVAAADLALDGAVRRIDAVRAGDRWYVGVLAGGFDALVNARANRMAWPRGPRRYELAVLAELRVFRPLPYTLRLDGRALTTEAMLVAVGNLGAYGGGLRVCHGAQPDDGLLDVLVVHRLSRAALLAVLPRVRRGGHLAHPAVELLRGREVRLDAPGVVAYADGERLGPLPLTCRVAPGALAVVAPGHP